MKFIQSASSIPKPLNLYSAMFALLMSMSGCSTTVLNRPNEPYQENLLARCPQDLPRLAGPTGSDFDLALRQYSNLYVVCAARHNQLVTEIQLRKDVIHEQRK